MFKDAEIANEDFYEGPFARYDFSHSEFTNCNFHSCKFERADFLGAIFENCDFYRCVFDRAYLAGVRFNDCNFIDCSLNEAFIFRSQLLNCDLNCCSMHDVMLSTVDFTGTEFRNVRWKHTCINTPPLIVEGIEYPIVALDNGYMHVGCEFNTYDWFWNTDEKHSAAMEGLRARRFWKRNKQWIFDMLKARKLYDYTRG